MAFIKISVMRKTGRDYSVVYLSVFDTGLSKKLTSSRVARILAQKLPSFLRRKGRSSAFSGVEVLPVVTKTKKGWEAWRLYTIDESDPSGYEPPVSGRVGKLNSRGNPYSNRSIGIWERADISEFDS